MWVRVTIDREFVIRAIEAVTDGMPYPGARADRIGPAYAEARRRRTWSRAFASSCTTCWAACTAART